MIGHIVTWEVDGIVGMDREPDPAHPLFAGREVSPEDVLAVGIERPDVDVDDEWLVGVVAQQFIRRGPVLRAINASVDERVATLAGVDVVHQSDTETWTVEGRVDGVTLLTAFAEVLDDLAAQLIEAIESPEPPAPEADETHAIWTDDHRWQCSCGLGRTGSWADVVRAARAHDKETRLAR